jgi:L-seryl-tRNA(Ser) seleniumtransferase
MHPALRALPSVDELASRLEALAGRLPRPLLVAEARRAIEHARARIQAGELDAPPDLEAAALAGLALVAGPSQERVINATGVVLHTNLGRAPLAALRPIAGYSNLEYDLATGARGRRDVHVAGLLERLLDAPAIAVNNNAAAVYLALNELACGAEVIVSRGELVEIGDGFRIPDIMRASGAALVEVGATNRTTLDDYRAAITPRTRLLLRVHRSNFRITGFTAQPALHELAQLAREHGLPLYEDLGSGCLAPLREFGVDEPLATASLRAGVPLVSFSGDKLLGGPQSGILAGEPALVQRLRRNPMYRALRLDKLILQALENTLRDTLLARWDRIPALRMIRLGAEDIRARALLLLKQIPGELFEGRSLVGGGSTPDQSLPTWLIAVRCANPVELERLLRTGSPPVVARIEQGRLVVDLRTVAPEEETKLVAAFGQALAAPA